MHIKRLLTTAACSLLVITAGLSVGAAPAAGQVVVCSPANVGNTNNGATWYSYAPTDEDGSSNGWGSFDEYGEILRVRDNDSDGRRIWVELLRCDTGVSKYYSSGPDEGPIDRETHDLDIPDGVVIFFRACVSSPFEGPCDQPVKANA
jgi:hypothetical protein